MNEPVKESPIDRAVRVFVLAMMLLVVGCCTNEGIADSCFRGDRNVDTCDITGLKPFCQYEVFYSSINFTISSSCALTAEVTAESDGKACIFDCDHTCPPPSCISCPDGNCPRNP